MDERQLLYPSIDFARQTYHASKTAIKPKFYNKDSGASDKAETMTQASTAATSAVGDKQRGSPMKPGVVIAKISTLSDEQLDRLLRA